MIFNALDWLSDLFDVPLQLMGPFLARAIMELDCNMLYYCPCGLLLTMMEVVRCILPTAHEVWLCDVPFASEMGEPESWIVAIGGDLWAAYDYFEDLYEHAQALEEMGGIDHDSVLG